MTKTEAIQLGQEWISNAPPTSGIYYGPTFFSGIVGLACNKCCHRIMARGCNLKRIANVPIWDASEGKCDLCGWTVFDEFVATETEREQITVTRAMAMDAGMPEIEGTNL